MAKSLYDKVFGTSLLDVRVEDKCSSNCDLVVICASELELRSKHHILHAVGNLLIAAWIQLQVLVLPLVSLVDMRILRDLDLVDGRVAVRVD